MIAIEVELLTRRYVAARFDDRDAAEWPPHPARLFSALVATAHEDGAGGTPGERGGDGRSALAWLEAQGAPDVLASGAEPRSVIATYVPENTTRVLSGWSKQEEKLTEAEAALAETKRRGDEKAAKRASRAVERARAKLDARIAGVIADDGKANERACDSARQLLPNERGKQPRAFPSITPTVPRIRYEWPAAEPDREILRALSDLAGRLVRLGHASSLVACRILRGREEASDAFERWIPADSGVRTLRVPEPGQLERLERAYARHRGIEPRTLPARHQPYRRHRPEEEALARSHFGEWLVLREIPPEDGRRLGLRLTRTEDLTRALRGALLRHADDPPPPVLSGHTADGRPLDAPHVAFLPLADVLSRHSGGAILGAAIVLPRDIDAGDRRAVLRAVGRFEQAGLRLTMGRAGVMHLERVVEDDPRRTLAPSVWTAPAQRWATVTPIALDENPGDLQSRDPIKAAEAAARAEQLIALSCERTDLPRPRWVQIMRRSLLSAAPAARRFMPFPRRGNGFKRVCVHAELCFGERVAGPVLLGAGRYFGLGLCLPREERR